jgi:hypothetical protein
MAFFDFFSLLMAAAFLILACRPQHVRDMVRYRKALTLFLWSLVLFYPISAIFMIGVYLGFVAHPVGMVLIVLSFRHLCLALICPACTPEPQPPSLT